MEDALKVEAVGTLNGAPRNKQNNKQNKQTNKHAHQFHQIEVSAAMVPDSDAMHIKHRADMLRVRLLVTPQKYRAGVMQEAPLLKKTSEPRTHADHSIAQYIARDSFPSAYLKGIQPVLTDVAGRLRCNSEVRGKSARSGAMVDLALCSCTVRGEVTGRLQLPHLYPPKTSCCNTVYRASKLPTVRKAVFGEELS
jgi:hypothetical protein